MIVEEAHLLDSNVLVYAFARDSSEDPKREVARSLVENAYRGGMTVVSAQNMAEFASVLIHKQDADFDRLELALNRLETIVEVFPYTAKTVRAAARLSKETGIHFYDALLVATMREHNVGTIVTENERDFRKIPGLTVINPFVKPAILPKRK